MLRCACAQIILAIGVGAFYFLKALDEFYDNFRNNFMTF